jgi:g-D-glutamyl-meso-diaminopimelate peptidase
MLFCSAVKCYATDFTVVDVSQQIYSYDSLCEDIAVLTSGHEDFMSYESLAQTSQGRNIWLIKFGNPAAEKRILITTSIHAREYMTAQLVMRMLEEYVLNYDTAQEDGTTYRQFFGNICFYIMPMLNPDGVTMCQYQPGMSQLKANANGVDLNRNFPIGFGHGVISSTPGLSYYPGPTPLSELETQALSNLINTVPFMACINYHSMGKINYYGASTNSPENAERCKYLANVVCSVNGYRPKYCGDACGSFADYFYEVTDCPSVTIEIGTANPVPISQFTDIYNKNVGLWKVLAALFL